MSDHLRAEWTVILDAQVTRRKRFHGVADPSGNTVFKHWRFSECVEFLKAEDQTSALLWCPHEQCYLGRLRIGET